MEGYAWRMMQVELLRGLLRTYLSHLLLHSTSIAPFHPLDPSLRHCVGIPRANSTGGVCQDNWYWHPVIPIRGGLLGGKSGEVSYRAWWGVLHRKCPN